MKNIFIAATVAGVFAAFAGAIAQDQTQPSTQTTQQDNNVNAKAMSMKECMARQKAANSGLTNLQMQTTCKNEAKASKTRKSGNDLATGPQAGDQQPKQP
jgi:hypothetical protein